MTPHEVVEMDQDGPKLSQVTYVVEEIIEYEVIYVQKDHQNAGNNDQYIGDGFIKSRTFLNFLGSFRVFVLCFKLAKAWVVSWLVGSARYGKCNTFF